MVGWVVGQVSRFLVGCDPLAGVVNLVIRG